MARSCCATASRPARCRDSCCAVPWRGGSDGIVTRKLGIAASLLAVLLLAVGPVLAHHGWSGYDSSTTLDLTGVIKESGHEHPHGFLTLEVPGKTWRVVPAPPPPIANRGV